MLFNLYFLFELFAFLSCAYAYKKLDNNFKIFLPFLAFVVVYEFINMCFLCLVLWHHSNAWCNNIEGIIELVVYGYFMASLDKRKPYRRRVYIAVAIGIILSLIDIIFIHDFWTFASIAIMIQNIILATLVCIYYYNLINNLGEYPDLITFPPFLAATGLLLYSLSGFLYNTTFDYFAYQKNYPFLKTMLIVQEISIAFIYTFLGISFLCFLRTKRLS